MPFDTALSERIRTAIGRKKNIEEKTMFGGVGFLLNGNMLVGVWKDSMIVQVGDDDGREALRERHVKCFDITGKVMKGWIMVGAEGVGAEEDVKGWVQRAVKFVSKLPGQ